MADLDLTGHCHCGAVQFAVTRPDFAVSCNCSICRRYATLWTHAPPMVAEITASQDQQREYVWGDRKLAFCSCASCGCITHWRSLESEACAVNLRLCDPDAIADLPVRRFDGADTWAFLD